MTRPKTPLALRRKEAGYTQAEFAPLVGQGLRSYQKIESDPGNLPGAVAEEAARLIGPRIGRYVHPYIELYTGRIVPGPAPQPTAQTASRATSTGYRGKGSEKSRRATAGVHTQRPPARHPRRPPRRGRGRE